MKVVLIFLIGFAFVQCFEPFTYAPNDAPALTKETIVGVNDNRDLPWEAALNTKFAKLSIGEAKKFLGLKQFSWQKSQDLQYSNVEAQDLKIKSLEREQTGSRFSSSFDARKQWPGCIHSVLNQGDCGSCWAFAGSESFSDRLCIDSNKTVNVVLAPQDLVSCAPFYGFDFGCDGGLTQSAWVYMAEVGVVSNECWPYTSGKDGETPPCRATCVNATQKFTRYYADLDSIGTYFGEEQIMQALLHGPVEAAFMIFNDFFAYKSGVYVRTSFEFVGLHAIKILGWGETASGVKYWICQNSWGTDWGMAGYFNFLRGENECMIESDVVAGNAKL